MQNEPDGNQSARQLWEQIFANMVKSEDATLVSPDYDSADEEARLRTGLAQAGWTEQEMDARIKIYKAQHENAPVTSPGVSAHVETQLARLCDDIEAAMTRLGLDSQARLARGIEPRDGPYASMTNVIMTRQGIVTVSSFMFRFCGLVARAFTRTLSLNPSFWESEDYLEENSCNFLKQQPALTLYWLRIYLSFAITGTHVLVPFQPANKDEVILFEQVARAMELFAIGHEYGHHHHGHGRQLEDDQKQEEFDADRFAIEVGYEVEQQPLILWNPYLSSGAGGAILLLALDTLRKINEIISGNSVPPSDTHPTTIDRLAQFEQLSTSFPDDFKAIKGFRIASVRIMTTVDACITNSIASLPPERLKELRVLLTNR
ncbi:MAG: hypothetical protein B7Y56_15490 [Gallionellales bacterium 35-53-114]|jgi:hypothetical protein|nr:MAG: hypothetical protein B7Y56_15490 [Gallionellales bacterium 35-53-114]OZB07237.1 MAG: hypothetical protein B7X61_15340 [Gallionellales bacterium 39-52-133]